MGQSLEKLVQDISITGESISTSLTINGSPEVYQLLEERGNGGQGILYKAQRGDAIVAVKILDRKPKREDMERFKVWESLHDVSGVTHIIAHGRSSLELQNYAVVSEYVDGPSVQQVVEQLETGTSLPENVICEILQESAIALGEIHARNVLHRDMKPSNIMIDQTGKVNITDFGAARSADVHTMTATMMGTPSYLAPEQYQKPSQRSDVYSLGLTMYYLMTGQHPPLMPSLDHKRNLSFEGLEYSPELVSIVRKMCEHDVTKRYESIGAVVRDLNRVSLELIVSPNEEIAQLQREIAVLEKEREGIDPLSVFFFIGSAFTAFSGYLGIAIEDSRDAEVIGALMATFGSVGILICVPHFLEAKYGQSNRTLSEKKKEMKNRLEALAHQQDTEKALAMTAEEVSSSKEIVEDRKKYAYGAPIIGIAAVIGTYIAETKMGNGIVQWLSLVTGGTIATTALATYGAFGHQYWSMRKKLGFIDEVRGTNEKKQEINPYLRVEWQDPATRGKEPQPYDTAKFIIQTAGFTRFPTCAEQMSLLIDGLEGRLHEDQYKALFADMMTLSSNKGEWTCEEMKVVEKSGNFIRKGRKELHIYRNNHLVPVGNRFYGPNDHVWKADAETVIDITGMRQGATILLEEMPEQLVQHFFSRPHRELPLEIQQKGVIDLPSPMNELFHIIRVGYQFRTLYRDQAFFYRGVRERKI